MRTADCHPDQNSAVPPEALVAYVVEPPPRTTEVTASAPRNAPRPRPAPPPRPPPAASARAPNTVRLGRVRAVTDITLAVVDHVRRAGHRGGISDKDYCQLRAVLREAFPFVVESIVGRFRELRGGGR